ncbi:flagellar basal body rod protein FlgC [Photobacterium sanguinicancri]|uniref:Flagellar basal-body rod protein FlgC n=1 Tax=Photobacterium sanguinicancri TaxID=875932 RepID=A0AAW7Y5C7_9GAMM|nr:flagellar basal body rod protein FlgC [Photobacterium sanguinicancri]KXI22970.1 flagellar basal-body rod protein FlgC [Photobacterium sanguinicancri]MDO6500179.1 flagellar basal body rod protein FlgC [Photobacterium sanguinicancri]MDO6543831.1 flagellar basal body rod protein FlgC [Photobacterium sanguinicancri]OZS44547.1 flagellar basal body rod protein FlgC [Photobacterium sanguinicancri]
MSFSSIYDIAGSAMTAQSVRLNTVASNIANADVVSGSERDGYRAKRPVFSSVMVDMNDPNAGTRVRIDDVIESDEPLRRRYEPNHPEANKQGYVFHSTVNVVEEMADMMAASRSFETNVDVMSRARSMQQSILRLGQTS